jgi:DNA polymerase-3 subunit delta
MASFKPAYLIHGDDHGRISERRSRLRALAESESGAQGLELFEGENSTPDAIALALAAMTFAFGRRFIVVDGVERWKDKEMDALEAALKTMPPETTVSFFAREDGRMKAPPRLHAAVKKAGGDIAAEASVKPWELPKWVAGQARALGLQLEPDAARALIAHVGDRQQRLVRELEKLALGLEPGAVLDVATVEELSAPSAERRAWSLADALVSGDQVAATRVFLALRSQGERASGLIYWMSQRVRTALDIAQSVDAGEPPAQIKRRLRMPSKAADALIADARRSGAERLRATLEEIADLEVASRGGGPGGAGEDTAMVLALRRIAA